MVAYRRPFVHFHFYFSDREQNMIAACGVRSRASFGIAVGGVGHP